MAISSACLSFAAVVVAFTNDFSAIAFDDKGCLAEVVDLASGRQLQSRPMPATAVIGTASTDEVGCNRMTVRGGNRLVFSYPGWEGETELSVRVERWGFVFRTERVNLTGRDRLHWFLSLQVWPTAEIRHYGNMLNADSDDRHVVVVRAYDLESWMPHRDGMILETRIDVTSFDPVGQRVALLAVPRDRAVAALRRMTSDYGGFRSPVGGAWSLGAAENRRSYLMATASAKDIDDWIALAERGGLSTLHFYSWFKTCGHYEPDPVKFPGGSRQLKEAIGRVRAAGLHPSAHTFTSGISFKDPWISPACREDLLPIYTYTLAEPLAEDAVEMVVEERPGPDHHFDTAFLRWRVVVLRWPMPSRRL